MTEEPDASGLVERIHDAPTEVLAEALELLDDASLTARGRVLALWAAGLARRELGQFEAARTDLLAGIHAAADPVLAGRIETSLAVVEMHLGNGRDAHALLDHAEAALVGPDLARALMQRGLLRHREGRFDEAIEHYTSAIELLPPGTDTVAEMRTLVNLGLLLGQRGDVPQGRERLDRAAELARGSGQHLMEAMAVHNAGCLTSLGGDTPNSLRLLDRAEELYSLVGDPASKLVVSTDRALVLLRSGLASEAADEADRTVAAIRSANNVLELADAQLIAARAHLALGDHEACAAAATEAASLFTRLDREPYVPAAHLLSALADEAAESSPSRDGARFGQLAAELLRHGWNDDAVVALVHAGRAHVGSGDLVTAGELLGIARERLDPARVADAVGVRLLDASIALAEGDRSRAKRSVSAGLRSLAANQATLGAIELRAHVLSHGQALATLGGRIAVDEHRPRELLRRIESARGIAALLPPTLPPDDDELASLLAERRALGVARGESIGDPAALDALDGQIRAVERRVSRLLRHATSTSSVAPVGRRVDEAIASLGDRVVVEFANIEGDLWAVVVASQRATMHRVGAVDSIASCADDLAFALSRTQRRPISDASLRAAEQLAQERATELAQRLLPSRLIGSAEEIVVVPTARLHHVAWSFLPSVRDRSVVVAPSLVAHVRAHDRPSRSASAGLIAGPTLPGAAREVERIAPSYEDATVVDPHDAVVDRCLRTLSRVDVAHLACHGRFRADNALFSSLMVADGDLTIHDLHRCAALPSIVVLPSCDAARSSVVGGGALLGLTAALVELGVSSVIAPLTPINDDASVDVMVRLHDLLSQGERPGRALSHVAAEDPRWGSITAAFLALGA